MAGRVSAGGRGNGPTHLAAGLGAAAGFGGTAGGLTGGATGGAGLAAAGLTAAGGCSAFLASDAGLACLAFGGGGGGGGGGGAFLRRFVASARGWMGCDLSTLPGQALSNAVPLPQPRGHLKPVFRLLPAAGR